MRVFIGGIMRRDDMWDGLTIYKLFRNAEGEWFPYGMPKWVGFRDGKLIGEFDSERKLKTAFLDMTVQDPVILETNYKGINYV